VNFKHEVIVTDTEDLAHRGREFPSTLPAAGFLFGATIAALLAIIAPKDSPGIPEAQF
jgi:hypothetical protein